MSVEPSFALFGALIGVPARANMMAALMDGRAQTASELAFVAGVTPQTASSHLAKLTEAGLLAVERQGRHRYYRLAGPAVADALEPLSHLAPSSRAPERRRAQLRRVGELRDARFCYDHLAGRLGVALTDSLLKRRFLRRDGGDFRLGPRGRAFLEGLGRNRGSYRSRRPPRPRESDTSPCQTGTDDRMRPRARAGNQGR
jgi:DNA-binding transcriptional ArsR family regulator